MARTSKPLTMEDVERALEKDRQRLADAIERFRMGKTTEAHLKAAMKESDKLFAEVKKLMTEAKQRRGKGQK